MSELRGGSILVKRIVPLAVNVMISAPASALASSMAARREQFPPPSLQIPSPGLLSLPSVRTSTAKLAAMSCKEKNSRLMKSAIRSMRKIVIVMNVLHSIRDCVRINYSI